eukprot:159918_1
MLNLFSHSIKLLIIISFIIQNSISQTTNLPSPEPTEFPSYNPTSIPTRAPNVGPDEIVCGDILRHILPQNDQKIYSLILSFDVTRIFISLCSEFLQFPTELILRDINGVIIATDQLCEPISQNINNATFIDITTELSTGFYEISISSLNADRFGVYQISLTCFTHAPTIATSNAPTEIPTQNPSIDPTEIPTIIPTENPVHTTEIPTEMPTIIPTKIPLSNEPTQSPSKRPIKWLSRSDSSSSDSSSIYSIVNRVNKRSSDFNEESKPKSKKMQTKKTKDHKKKPKKSDQIEANEDKSVLEENHNGNKEEEINSKSMILNVLLVAIFVIGLVIMCILYGYYKKLRKEHSTIENSDSESESEAIEITEGNHGQ